MIVQFSCNLCGLHRVNCEVPEREPGQDVLAWTDATVSMVCRNHDWRSPGCHPKQLSELLIPMDHRQCIGGPVIQ